jgi:tetratricopeptide (TPR) repeat protein
LQARVAEQRFNDLREFARAVVFDVSDSLMPIPGTTAARKLLVDTALRYLDRLAEQRTTDSSLREELAAAYIRVARVQGGAFLPNLGETAGAITSFHKAIEVIGPAPATPGLERLRIEAHVNLGQLASDPIQATPDYDLAIAAAERQLARTPDDVAMLRLLAQAFHGKATNAHLTDDVPQHETAAARAIAIRERIVALSPGRWQDETDLAKEHSQHALALAQKGEPAAALTKLRHARALLEGVLEKSPGNQVILRELADSRSRAGVMLMLLGKLAESVHELQAAIDMFAPLVRADASNRQYQAELATTWWRLGDTRRAEGRLDEALTLHQRALRVSRERAERDSGGMFVRWGLAMRLTAVGELLLEISPTNWREARGLFVEARDLVEPLVAQAPSFNELRKQLAASYEGIGRAELAAHGASSPSARAALGKGMSVWREVFTRSNGDRRQIDRLHDLERLMTDLDRGRGMQ